MQGQARETRVTERAELDAQLARLKDAQREFARLDVRARRGLVEGLLERSARTAREAVDAACAAKGIGPGTRTAAEEWLAGPVIQIRHVRLLLEALEDIERRGRPRVRWQDAKPNASGGLAVPVFPSSGLERVIFPGFTAETWLEPGITKRAAQERQASVYRDRQAEGGVSLVLGAGNVASIGPLDALHKMFAEGKVVLLKMNPVNDYLGPIIERQFEEFIARGFLAVAYGGAEVGAYLTSHPAVDDIHITGSDKTHDAIVWGPPGAEREARKERGEPLLDKPISSELGNVTPILIAPGPYRDVELREMAGNVAAMLTNNASFNCNAAKLLVTPTGWRDRERFLGYLGRALARIPARYAYYPGAAERYARLTRGRSRLLGFGAAGDDVLPWTLVPGLDANDVEEPFFRTEAFCSVLAETSVGSDDAEEFLAEATDFANERVWGTLCATLFVHPSLQRDARTNASVESAIGNLRYGTVAVNHWAALGYGFCTTPWGAYPGATLEDIQSGRGWVHNTPMLEGVEKAVVRGPLLSVPRPAWFPTHRSANVVAQRLAEFEAKPRWRKLPRLAAPAIFGA